MVTGLSECNKVELGKDVPALSYNCLFCPDHKLISGNTPLEHVFPKSWAGDLFIGHFSCKECNNLMGKFESVLWRHPVRYQGLLGNLLQFDITGKKEFKVPQDPWKDVEMMIPYTSHWKVENNKAQAHQIRKPMGRLAAKIMLCMGATLQPVWFFDKQFDIHRSFVLKGIPNLLRDLRIFPAANRPFNPSDVHYIVVTHFPNEILIEVLFFGHYGVAGIFPVRYLKKESSNKPETRSIVAIFNIRERWVGFRTFDENRKTIIGPIYVSAPLEITRANMDTYYDGWLGGLS